jgi:hypothetical protein
LRGPSWDPPKPWRLTVPHDQQVDLEDRLQVDLSAGVPGRRDLRRGVLAGRRQLHRGRLLRHQLLRRRHPQLALTHLCAAIEGLVDLLRLLLQRVDVLEGAAACW